MMEVIWHARGGQGAFTAARCLGAAAALSAGKAALAFPTFGPERRGAPMRAFTKIADEPIGDRSAVQKAQFVVYLDETLMEKGWEDELAEDGVVLLNTRRASDDPRIVAIDADGLATQVLGRPIPNTVFLGVIPALTEELSVEDVHEGVCATMPRKLHEKNLALVDAAYQQVVDGQAARAAELAAEAHQLAEAAQAVVTADDEALEDVMFVLAADLLLPGEEGGSDE